MRRCLESRQILRDVITTTNSAADIGAVLVPGAAAAEAGAAVAEGEGAADLDMVLDLVMT